MAGVPVSSRWIGTACSVAALVLAPVALADEIRVAGNRCTVIHLLARDARLSHVLAALGRTLDFQVSFESDRDPVLNVDATGSPSDIVASIAAGENTSRTHALDSRCRDRMRLVKMWVLPGRRDGASGEPASATPASDASRRTASTYDGNYLLLTTSAAASSGARSEAAGRRAKDD